MTAQQAGELLGIDQARMSNIAAGRVGISSARIRTLTCNYLTRPVLLDMEAQLEKYRTLLDRMEQLALDPPTSREFVHTIIDSL